MVVPTIDAPPFRLPVPPGPGVDDAFVRAACAAGTLLPAEITDALAAFVDDPGPTGALRVRNLPIGEVPATPSRPSAVTAKDPTSEFTVLTAARRLGEPVGYVQEHGGGLVQDIVPAPLDEGRQLSTSSSVRLEWHTETAFHPHKPRYLLLLCLRGDASAETMCCAIEAVLPHLDAGTLAVLRAPRFRTRPDASFLEDGMSGAFGPPMAVLTGNARHPTLAYDEDLMIGTDAEAQAALDRLGVVLHDHASGLVLEAGELLVLDNHRVVHARSPFRARFDGTDRWLQRGFVVADLAPSAGERSGRIITTAF